MATESSAVVRFINLVQKEQHPLNLPQSAPIQFEPNLGGSDLTAGADLRVKSSKTPLLVVGVLVFAGAAAGAGIYFGKNHFGSSSSASSAPTPPPAPNAAQNGALPPGAPAPQPAAAPAIAPTRDADSAVPAPVVSVPPDVLAETGFDIRVAPGGTVSVDSQALGVAPLRIRNLTPGPHVIDIEAPAGFFSRRIEVDLVAGVPQVLNYALDSVDEAVAAAGAKAEKADDAPAPRRPAAAPRLSRKEKRAAERVAKEAKEREAKEAKALAAREAKEAKEAREKKAREVKAASAPRIASTLNQTGERVTVKAEPLDAAEPSAAKAKVDPDLDAAMASVTGEKSTKKAAKVNGGGSAVDSGPPGTLMLGSKPLCDIYINGKATGLKTPQRAMELAPGTYKVKLVNGDLGIDKTFKVKIASGKTTKAIQDLRAK